MDDVYVNFTFVDEFEPIDPIYFEMYNSSGQTLIRKHYLSGTEQAETDLKNFTAKSAGDFIYITHLDEKMVYAIYNVKTKEGYPAPTDGKWEYVSSVRDRLVNKLKLARPELKYDWER